MSDTEKPSWEWQQEVERLTNALTSAEMRSVAHLKMYNEASQQLAAKDATIQETVMLYQSRIDALRQQLAEYKNALSASQDEMFKMQSQLAAMTQRLHEQLSTVTDADVQWANERLAAQKHQEGLP